MASTHEDLFQAIEAGDAAGVDAILDREPAAAAARDGSGVSALMRALYRFDAAVTDTVRRRVPELDVFEAAALGDVDQLGRLLDTDPGIAGAYSGDGFTPLHFAAFFGNEDAVGILLDHGAEVDAFGRGWMTGTALHSAVSRLQSAVVRMLLEAGANPNVRQSAGWTPLHSSAANGDAESAGLLLRAGADPAAANDEGRTVLQLANESHDATTLELIRSALQAAP